MVIVFRNNLIRDADGEGLYIENDVRDNSGVSNITIANNTITGAIAGNALEIDADVGDGGGGSATFTILGNSFLNPGNDGIDINVDAQDDGGTASFTFTGNTITGGNRGIDFDVDADNSGSGFSLILVFTNNSITGAGDDGIEITADIDGGDMSTTLNGNVFLNNGASSISINIDGGDDVDFFGTVNNTSAGAGSGFSLVGDNDSTGTFILDGTAVDPSTDPPVAD